MLWLSELLMQNHELESFDQLEDKVKTKAQEGTEFFFRMDVKPPFTDTPDNWEDRLEAAFTSALPPPR